MNIIGLDVTHSTTHMLLHSKFMCPHFLYHSRNSFTFASVRACLSVEIQQLQNSSVSARRSINPKIRLYVLPSATYKYEFRWKSDRKFVGKSMRVYKHCATIETFSHILFDSCMRCVSKVNSKRIKKLSTARSACVKC